MKPARQIRKSCQEIVVLHQVDALRPGLLGPNREAFAHRYCNRRLVPVFGRGGAQRMKWCNTGLAHAAELHALLKQVLLVSS